MYCAVGERYISEAARAASTVRRSNPGLPICLVADAPTDAPAFDSVILLETPRRSIADKLQMWRSPFERTVFLDSDTAVFRTLDPLFALLERFDVAAHPLSGGNHYTIEGMPNAFPEFNTGVIAFRKSPEAAEFFRLWRELFDRYEPQMGREWDQRSFRHAAWLSPARIAPIPAEYNIMPYFIGKVIDDVSIVHGRPHEKLLEIEAALRTHAGDRAFVPRYGVVRHFAAMSVAEHARFVARAAAIAALEVLKRATGKRTKLS